MLGIIKGRINETSFTKKNACTISLIYYEFISGMLQIIAHEGFGKRIILKDKADVFMKPHPTTISPNDYHLLQGKVSYEEYTTAYMTKPSERDWRPAVSVYNIYSFLKVFVHIYHFLLIYDSGSLS